jgi:DNA repair protein RAD50
VTGEWPPNSHAGKSFIHDPKVRTRHSLRALSRHLGRSSDEYPSRAQVAAETEVKGQIKLQCKTVTGKPFVVVRSFQLTRKSGGKYEFKALDQTISTINEHGDVRERASCACGAHTRRHTPCHTLVGALWPDAAVSPCL